MEIIKYGTTLDFIGKKKVALFLSLSVIIFGIFLFILKGRLKLGIDFAGGTLIQLQFKNKVSIDKVRESFRQLSMGNSSIQRFGSDRDILIQAERISGGMEDLSTVIREIQSPY